MREIKTWIPLFKLMNEFEKRTPPTASFDIELNLKEVVDSRAHSISSDSAVRQHW